MIFSQSRWIPNSGAMALNNFYLSFTLVFCVTIIGLSEEHLPPGVEKACRAIYNPEVLSTSCCPQIDAFAQKIGNCLTCGLNGESVLTSCSEVDCIAKAYDVQTADKQIDLCKIDGLIKNLDMIDEETKIMDKLVREYCLKGNYTSFPSVDDTCVPWKYLNCVVFAYNIACSHTISTGKCAVTKENIGKCRPYANKYVNMLNHPEQCIVG